MKKRGFTLVELLAVIVILAIVCMITVPVVMNIVTKSRKSAFKDTAYGLLDSAKTMYLGKILQEGYSAEQVFSFSEGKPAELDYSGRTPQGGIMRVSEQGEISLAIYDSGWCAVKEANEATISVTEYDPSTCIIKNIPNNINYGRSVAAQLYSQSDEVLRSDPDKNMRYVGKNPNNYVKFNNELWRIIGSFDGQAKIIREEFYSDNISWSHNRNRWNESSLQEELNSVFLNAIEKTSKNYIDMKYPWKLGSISNIESDRSRFNVYHYERGYKGENNNAYWLGAVGLMYPSDYGYATSSDKCEKESMYHWNELEYQDCFSSNWLHSGKDEWLLTPIVNNDIYISSIYNLGYVSYTNVTEANAVRPVLYLKKDVKIISGAGTKEDPFELGI